MDPLRFPHECTFLGTPVPPSETAPFVPPQHLESLKYPGRFLSAVNDKVVLSGQSPGWTSATANEFDVFPWEIKTSD
jgi:hypothetical protein